MLVVPAPMSTKTTPNSFSVSVKATCAAAKAEKTKASTLTPTSSMHFSKLRMAVVKPVIICASASKRTPVIPTGSFTPS